MGGFLAQPAKFYPHTFAKDGIFGRYPYLLPNLVAAIGILAAIVQGMFLLEETLVKEEKEENGSVYPDHHDERSRLLPPHGQPHSGAPNSYGGRQVRGSMVGSIRERGSIASFTRERLASMSVAGSIRQIRKRASFMEEGMPSIVDQRFDIRRESFGTMHSIRIQPHRILPTRGPPAPPRKTFNKTVTMMILSMALFAFHQMAYISILPVYITDDPVYPGLDFKGGLGRDLHEVGIFLAVNGFITLFVQGFIFPIFVEWVGVWNSFFWMIVLYPITYIIVPFVSGLPTEFEAYGLYLSLLFQAFFGIIVFPCALILMKNAIPSPLVLGRVNGVAMSAACLSRTISSPMVGLVYSLGGSAAAWFGLAIVAFIGIIQLIWVPKEDVGPVAIENGLKKALHHDHYDDNAVDDISVIDSVR